MIILKAWLRLVNTNEKEEHSNVDESNDSSDVTESEDRESDADDWNNFNEYLNEYDDYSAAVFNNNVEASKDRGPDENVHDSENDNSAANSYSDFEA